jgi:hypothetical protein
MITGMDMTTLVSYKGDTGAIKLRECVIVSNC